MALPLPGADLSRRIAWLPRPVWVGGLTITLVLIALALSVGVPAYQQQVAIREINRLGGKVRQVPFGPEWIRKLIGDEWMKRVDEVDRVDFASTQIADSDLACLKGLRGLRELELWGTPITGAGIVHLKDLPNLRSLGLGWRLDEGELAHLEKLTNIEELGLCGPQVTDASLSHLGRLTRLRSLTLSDRHITDAGIAHLKGLVNLQRLRLSGTGISDAGLVHLRAMGRLECLALDSNDISDVGVASLLSLSRLQHLYLGGTRITDAGLGLLKRLPRLEQLNISGAPVTKAGIADLKTAFPNLTGSITPQPREGQDDPTANDLQK